MNRIGIEKAGKEDTIPYHQEMMKFKHRDGNDLGIFRDNMYIFVLGIGAWDVLPLNYIPSPILW